ncbi:MAG: hypothetical protein ACI8W3_002152 [Myxococcota bacterium]|jgi:hypothetical protein
MKLFMTLGSGALLLTCGLVGLRLLWLSWRTGGMPERLLGIGYSSVIFVFVPLLVASGMGREQVGDVKLGLLAAGCIACCVGFTCVMSFTGKTFRPNEPWADVLIFVLSGAMAMACGGLIGAIIAGPVASRSFEVGQLWTGLLRAPAVVMFLWTGIEGIRHYRMARRRESLGLGSPVVTNRFMLWGLAGVSQGGVGVIAMTLHFSGQGAMISPGALLVTATGGLISATLMFIAFLPPKAYVKMLQRRAAAA